MRPVIDSRYPLDDIAEAHTYMASNANVGKIVIVLLLLGFVPTVFFAWAFELTPEGIKRESEVDRSESITPHTGKKLDRLIIGPVALVQCVVLFSGLRVPEFRVHLSQVIVGRDVFGIQFDGFLKVYLEGTDEENSARAYSGGYLGEPDGNG